MKSKIFKKIVAGIATLAMAVQFGFVLPASAADYFTLDFETESAYTLNTTNNAKGSEANNWYAGFDAGGMAIADDKTAGIGKYYKWASLGSGSRGAYFVFPETARAVANNQSVLEFDFKMNGSTYGNSQLVISGVEGNITCNAAYTSTTDYLLKFDMPNNGEITVNNGKQTSNYDADWAHAKAIFDFSKKTAIVSIASLSGTTYLNPMQVKTGSSATALYKIFLNAARGVTNMGIDNIKVRPYDADTDGVLYTVTYTGGLEEESEVVLSGSKLSNIPANPLKMGGYKFAGKWKDKDTNTEYTSAELAELNITENKTFEALFDADPSAIEKMQSMSISVHPEQQPELPVKAADGSDTTKEYPVKLSIIGEAGNELTAADYPYAKGDLTVTWSIDGFDSLQGVPTGEPIVRENGDLIYCDSYMTLSGFTGNKTEGKITLASGIGNYFGNFKVHVKYGNEEAGYVELEDEFPMVILADNSKPANRIYPLGGYFKDLNWYSDSLIGHAVPFNDFYTHVPDIFLSGWCMHGGRGTRAITLEKDETTGDKYLNITGGSATNSTAIGAFKMDTVGEQAYIDTDIQFSTNGETIFVEEVSQKHTDDKSDNRSDAYRSAYMTPYTNGMTFNGSALEAGENSIAMAKDKWYRLRFSFDDSVQEYWYQVWELDETGSAGALVGKSNPIPYNTSLTKLPQTMNYLALGIPNVANAGIKIKNTEIYKPEMKTFTASTDTETLTIPEGKPVTSTNVNAEKNTVKVLAEKASVTAEITNKTQEAEKINAFVVSYKADNSIAKISMGSATVAAGAAKSVLVNVPTDADIASRKLFVWTDKMEPLTTPTTFELDSSDKPDPIANLSTIKKDAEGNDLSGNVKWSLAEEYEGVSLSVDSENENNAVIKVTSAAAPGEIYAIAANRGQTARVKITLTGSSDNVVFLNPKTSVTIPFDDKNSIVTYSAEVRTGEGTAIEGKTVSYAIYDANNAQPLANTAGVSFDPATATLTVTKDAVGQIVYIRATSTNTDGEAIAKSIKVTIHGQSFDFGASDDEGVHDGYTPVTPDTVYTDGNGYGILGSVTAGGSASADDLNGDYIESTGDITFQVKVPKGKNYKVKVAYKGDMKVEKITSNLPGVSHPTNATLAVSDINVAVIDDILDLTVSGGAQLASVEIQMLPDKTPGDKPTWFTYGDSTTNSSTDGKVGWANVAQQYTTMFNVNNTARSGSNPEKYYNGGDINKILLNIAEGDLVTFNGMGTNGGTGNFETVITALTQACRDRGAYVIMTYYTPDLYQPSKGFTRDKIYSDSEHKFIGSLRDDATYTKIANEKGYPIIPFGQLGIDAMNDELDKVSTTDMAARDARANEIITYHLDHNHYSEPLAKIFAAKYVPPVEAAYQALVNADTK